jgi:ubiquinol-cytochrome c reductase cytochrome c1 subunit
MKNNFALIVPGSCITVAQASEVAWPGTPNKTNDMAALQNGAELSSTTAWCHSATLHAFNREDIGLTDQQIRTTCCSRLKKNR